MNLVHTSRKKVLALVVAIAMLATVITPLSASAYTINDSLVPKTPMEVDNNIIKIGAHAAATTAVHYLGGNLVTERDSDFNNKGFGTGEESASAKLENAKSAMNLTIFGSMLTSNPDPYLWNYFYNLYAEVNGGKKSNDAVYLVPNAGGPQTADTTVVEELGTSYTLDRRPEILYGTGDSSKNYNALITDIRKKNAKEGDADYNPIQVQANSSSIADQIGSMYELANAMNVVKAKTGKTGRYGDPMEIAKKYERLQKGLQLYVMSQIDAGKVKKKTVAVIDAEGSGTAGPTNSYVAYTSDVSQGTAASQRGAEYSENVADNLVNVLKVNNEGSEDAPVYHLTTEQLKQADVIITMGQQTQVTEEEMVEKLSQDGWSSEELKDVSFITTAPDGIFGITMNSVENIMGVPLMMGSLYPEIVNMYHGAMYIYENFWHTDSANLRALINANFGDAGVDIPEGTTTAGYDSATIEKMLDEGFKYYSTHAATIKKSNPKLVPTTNLGIKEVATTSKTSIRNATITGVPSKASAYTGKRKKPNVKVVLGAKTLKNGTDYKVTYSNNLRPGRATITVTGIGNYKDSKKAYFNISPKKASMKKTKVKKGRRLSVTWKRQTMATGYQVVAGTNRAVTKNKKAINVTRNKTTSKTFTKLKRGKRYYVKVRAYKKINGKKVYGAYSTVKKSAKIKR